jgi:hypothetical protein
MEQDYHREQFYARHDSLRELSPWPQSLSPQAAPITIALR